MSSKTIYIRKSKALLFKKLTFLYLVFILFLFLTSPGEYVHHYPALAQTQEQLNDQLYRDLSTLNIEDKEDNKIKLAALNFVKGIEDVESSFEDYSKRYIIQGVNLKESKFSENEIKKGNLAKKIETLINEFAASNDRINKQALMEDLIEPVGFQNEKVYNIYYYFHETPNGVIPSILEYFKTVVLYQSLKALEVKVDPIKKISLENLNESEFIEQFRKHLLLGEKVEVIIKNNLTDIEPVFNINGNTIPVIKLENGMYRVAYTPPKAGKYSVAVEMDTKFYYSNFVVSKPQLELISDSPYPLNLKLGQAERFTINQKKLPPLEDLNFISELANIEREGKELIITALHEGNFTVEVFLEDKFIDDIELFSSKPDHIKVFVADVNGNKSIIEEAQYIKADNAFWEVLNFKLTILKPDGSSESFHSNSRYFTLSSQKASKVAPAGSTFIFEDIQVISVEGKVSGDAQSFLISK